jgi:hypothetical protein
MEADHARSNGNIEAEAELKALQRYALEMVDPEPGKAG